MESRAVEGNLEEAGLGQPSMRNCPQKNEGPGEDMASLTRPPVQSVETTRDGEEEQQEKKVIREKEKVLHVEEQKENTISDPMNIFSRLDSQSSPQVRK